MRTKLIVTCLGLAIAAWMIAPTVASAAPQNHYACYQVKDLKIPAALASKQAGTYSTQFESTTYSGCKAKFLCMPTSKDGSLVVDPSLHYICHQCKSGAKNTANFAVSDQFVDGSVQAKKFKFLCNPADKTP